MPAAAQNNPGKLVVRRLAGTDRAVLVTTSDGSAISVTQRAGANGVRPVDFLTEYGALFGVTRVDTQLRQADVRTDVLGQTHTAFTQMHHGVPVFSGVLRVHQDANGKVIAGNGRFYPVSDKVPVQPVLGADQAVAVALAELNVANARVARKELTIVDPGWYGDPSIGPRLAYHIELIDPDAFVHEALFIDALDGQVLDRWSRVCTYLDRQIYTLDGAFSLPGTLARKEGVPPVSSPVDVNRAYDYYGDVYGYYLRAFNRDSIDGQGMSLVATVDIDDPYFCPNAAWISDFNQMIFCTGLVTDDIVGHELTHGVTERTANLIYQNQAGQLNEAFSDIFGELIDLFNGDAAFLEDDGGDPWPSHPTGPGKDTPNLPRTACSTSGSNYPNGVRWLMGEDALVTGGAIRDMWMPPCFGDPDAANSPLQICAPWDSGGVHSGSGILLRAFSLATDGGNFNGYTVSGVGPIKTGAVFYHALTTYLTPASDFEETYYYILQAGADLVGTTPNDPRTGSASSSAITAADVAEIDKAMLAVELNTAGRCGSDRLLDAGDPPVCGGRSTIYADDFESGVSGWQTVDSSPASASDAWRQYNVLPDAGPGTAWFVPNPRPIDYADQSGHQQLISPQIVMPDSLAFPALKFAQHVQTEFSYDGGNVKIKINDGNWKLIPASRFIFNGYNVLTLYSGSGNPLGGEPAFSGGGGSWYTSVIDLIGLVAPGDTIQVRFDYGQDEYEGLVGWYVDDFEVYDCGPDNDCNGNHIPDDIEAAQGFHPEVLLDQPANESAFVLLGDGFFNTVAVTLDYGLAYAEDFHLTQAKVIQAVRIWGGYADSGPGGVDEFRVAFRRTTVYDEPGAKISANSLMTTAKWIDTGRVQGAIPLWEIALQLSAPVSLAAGDYFIEVYRLAPTRGDFYWQTADYGVNYSIGYKDYFVAEEAPGVTWYDGVPLNLAMRVEGVFVGEDCNTNAMLDACEADSDHDGAIDDCDLCPSDPSKKDPGACGCGVADKDSDFDGTLDCNDGCALDGAKTEPGVCGCNVTEDLTDSDDDDTPDCADGCPADANKLAPGTCGCGEPDTDSDDDGVADCNDRCDDADDTIDTDKDGTPDCKDDCPDDPKKIVQGQCGCGVADDDPDDDDIASCMDNCPMHANPEQNDADGDGLGDMCDGCPMDPDKTAPGVCGCGSVDVDTDLDGLYDCADPCPKLASTTHIDADDDGIGDLCDGCPQDSNKTAPGVCGCGRADIDMDGDGVFECNDLCLNTPAGTPVDEDGCPLTQTPPPQPTPAPDGDGDGVADADDACPGTPTDVQVDATGCPVVDNGSSNGVDGGTGDGMGDMPCGPTGAVTMILLAFGLVGMRQRAR